MKHTMMFILIFTVLFFGGIDENRSENASQESNDISIYYRMIASDSNWDMELYKSLAITPEDDIHKAVELIGALRDVKGAPVLVQRFGTQTSLLVAKLQKSLRRDFIIAALVRIDSPFCEDVFKKFITYPNHPLFTLYLTAMMPADSAIALVEHYERQYEGVEGVTEKRMSLLKERIAANRKIPPAPLPPLSNFVLNHPLYHTRQSAIEANLSVLNKRKKMDSLDTETLSAINKLGELRAIEAVQPLVPLLLLKPQSTDNKEMDEKYSLIKDYPVAVALAQIGIPSIWGMLDEIAAGRHNSHYRSVAYQTMVVILPDVAIPGFVNAAIEKNQDDELAQQRLYQMYPLMGLPFPEPQIRQWESFDKLFKVTARFVSLNEALVTLERADGKEINIEFSVLRAEDQEYIKQHSETEKKSRERKKQCLSPICH